MNKWIRVEDELPPLSYVESDNPDDPYECYPVLVFSNEIPGIYCIAYLQKEQDKEAWDFGELSWQIYIPGINGGDIIDRALDEFDYWMPLPQMPNE